MYCRKEAQRSLSAIDSGTRPVVGRCRVTSYVHRADRQLGRVHVDAVLQGLNEGLLTYISIIIWQARKQKRRHWTQRTLIQTQGPNTTSHVI